VPFGSHCPETPALMCGCGATNSIPLETQPNSPANRAELKRHCESSRTMGIPKPSHNNLRWDVGCPGSSSHRPCPSGSARFGYVTHKTHTDTHVRGPAPTHNSPKGCWLAARCWLGCTPSPQGWGGVRLQKGPDALTRTHVRTSVVVELPNPVLYQYNYLELRRSTGKHESVIPRKVNPCDKGSAPGVCEGRQGRGGDRQGTPTAGFPAILFIQKKGVMGGDQRKGNHRTRRRKHQQKKSKSKI